VARDGALVCEAVCALSTHDPQYQRRVARLKKRVVAFGARVARAERMVNATVTVTLPTLEDWWRGNR
jgi:hypothetical protein